MSAHTFKTFKRSCVDWAQLSRARKITVRTGLTYKQAVSDCAVFNDHRTREQIKKGTKLEFAAELP